MLEIFTLTNISLSIYPETNKYHRNFLKQKKTILFLKKEN